MLQSVLCPGLNTQSEWTMHPVSQPDQLGSRARLMTVVNLAAEEWSCPHWTLTLCDWVGCQWACVCLHVCNASLGVNGYKQTSATGASGHNVASLPPEITTWHRCVNYSRTWLLCGVCYGERENEWPFPTIFNKLIKHCVFHPEAISRWFSHSSVMRLIDRGKAGPQEGGLMKGRTRERCVSSG